MILRTWAGALRTRISRVWDLGVSGTCGRQDSTGSRSQEMHKLGLGNIRLERLESKKIWYLKVRKFQGTSDLSLAWRDQGLGSGTIPILCRLEF